MNFGNNTLRVQFGNKLFYLAYGVRLADLLLKSSLLYEKYEDIIKPVSNICHSFVLFSLILIIIIAQSYTIKEFVNICLLTLVFLISSVRSNELYIIFSWLFVCAFKNCDLKIVAKETIVISLIVLVILIELTFVGIIDVDIWERSDTIMRYSIGYSNPNIAGCVVLQTIVAIFIGGKNNLLDLIIIFCGFLFCYIVLNCRSVSICICLLSFFYLLFRNCDDKSLKLIGFIIAILAPVFSIYISITYNPASNWMIFLDRLFSLRISYGNKYTEEYGFSIVGQIVDSTILGPLDNAYVKAAIVYGIIPFIIYIYAVIKLFVYNKKKSENIELICIIIMMLYGLMESAIYAINRNFTILILANVLYKRHAINIKNIFKNLRDLRYFFRN